MFCILGGELPSVGFLKFFHSEKMCVTQFALVTVFKCVARPVALHPLTLLCKSPLQPFPEVVNLTEWKLCPLYYYFFNE